MSRQSELPSTWPTILPHRSSLPSSSISRSNPIQSKDPVRIDIEPGERVMRAIFCCSHFVAVSSPPCHPSSHGKQGRSVPRRIGLDRRDRMLCRQMDIGVASKWQQIHPAGLLPPASCCCCTCSCSADQTGSAASGIAIFPQDVHLLGACRLLAARRRRMSTPRGEGGCLPLFSSFRTECSVLKEGAKEDVKEY